MDTDNRFYSLIQPIRDLASNWDVDIADSLETYLEELEHVRLSVKDINGKSKRIVNDLNFAEAALLIQGSTAIYSKKVEYLHQLVQQALELISNQKSGINNRNNNEDNDDDGNTDTNKNMKQKQVSLSIMDDERLLFGVDPQYLLLDDIVEAGSSIDLAVETSEEKRRRRSSGRHSMSGDLSKASMVLMHSILQEDHGGASLKMSTCHIDVSGALVIGGELAMARSTERGGLFSDNANGNIADSMMNSNWQHNDDDDAGDAGDYYGGYDDDYNDNDNIRQQEVVAVIATAAATSKTANVVTKNTVKTSISLMDPHESFNGSRAVKKGKSYVIPSSLMSKIKQNQTSSSSSSSVSSSSSSIIKGAEPSSTFSKLIEQQQLPLKGLAHNHFSDIITSMKKSRMNQLRANRYNSNTVTVTVTNDNDFLYRDANGDDINNHNDHDNKNNNNNNDYDDDDDVGGFWNDGGDDGYYDEHIPTHNPSDDGCSSNTNNGNQVAEGSQYTNPIGIQSAMARLISEEEELARRVESVLNEQLSQTQQYNSYESLCRRHIDNFMKGAERYARETQLSKRVSDWTSKLEPKLLEQEAAPSFDIHVYSDLVLSNCHTITSDPLRASSGNGDRINFNDVVHGKSSAEVCRTFLACLQLANLGNLEVLNSHHQQQQQVSHGRNGKNKSERNKSCDSDVTDSSNQFNNFYVQLLSKTRTKHVEKFNANAVQLLAMDSM